jgi:NAD(P)H dehydrogenase (quinone)
VRNSVPATDPPKSVVVVYDTASQGAADREGRTGAVANAVARGVEQVPGTRVDLVAVRECEQCWGLRDQADAIVFGCPTYMGSASAAMKQFMESTFSRFGELRWKDKLAAGFTNSAGLSGDKLFTLQQLAGFAAQHGMTWLTLGQLPGIPDAPDGPVEPNRLSSFLGLMTQSVTGYEDPPTAQSDLDTAEQFGSRIAFAAHSWNSDSRGVELARQIVLCAFGAVERRDSEKLKELYHPQVEFHWPPSLPYGGSSRGVGARPTGPTWASTWDPLQPTEEYRQLHPRVIAASDSEVTVLWRQRGVSQAGDVLDTEVLGLYRVSDGKFARAQMFYFDVAAVNAFLADAGAGGPAPTAAQPTSTPDVESA